MTAYFKSFYYEPHDDDTAGWIHVADDRWLCAEYGGRVSLHDGCSPLWRDPHFWSSKYPEWRKVA